MKRGLPPWLHTPVYYGIRAALGAMLIGEFSASVRTARSLARAYAKLESGRVARTIDNLRVAFPTMADDDLHRHAIEAYQHLFTLGVEMAYTPRLITADSWSDHVELGDLAIGLRELLAGGPGVLITGHCGNWELMGYTLALLGFPVHALYRPIDLEPMDRWVRGVRERRGLFLLDKFGATERLPSLMSSGAMAGFIADQNAGDRGLFVPFFNRLASTYKTIGLLAMRFNAPIICGQARRLGGEPWEGGRGLGCGGASEPHGGMRYRIDIIDVVRPDDWRDRPDPLFYVTARYRRALEQMVRRAPEQNLWLHRYWKSRPRHEHHGRPLPAALKQKIRELPWTVEDDILRIEEWTARDARELAARAPKPSKFVGAAIHPQEQPAVHTPSHA